MSDAASKIVVDDDWKSQIEKEKHAASGPVEEDAAADDFASATPPEASFEALVTMLFSQGMAALGQVPGGINKPAQINKPFAKYFIDTIELLGEKTKGNVSEDESKMLGEILHVLRMTFVSVKAPK